MSELILSTNVNRNNLEVRLYAEHRGLTLSESNQNIAVISKRNECGGLSLKEEDVVAFLVFNSDAGTDHGDLEGRHVFFNHEKLYAEEGSFFNTSDLSLLDEARKLAADWLYRYLLISAVKTDTSNTNSVHVFAYGIYSDHMGIFNWIMGAFDREMFEKNLDVLGFNNDHYRMDVAL